MNSRRGLGELTTSLQLVERRHYRSSQGAMLAMAMLEIERMRLAAEVRRIDQRLLTITQRQHWIANQQRSLWSIASQAGAAGVRQGLRPAQAAPAVPAATPVGARSRRLGY